LFLLQNKLKNEQLIQFLQAKFQKPKPSKQQEQHFGQFW
jgi:hypothetical protein